MAFTSLLLILMHRHTSSPAKPAVLNPKHGTVGTGPRHFSNQSKGFVAARLWSDGSGWFGRACRSAGGWRLASVVVSL